MSEHGERLRAQGYQVLDTWDHDAAVRHVLDRMDLVRRRHPDLYREYRQIAFELRAALHEELADHSPQVIEVVSLNLLGKIVGLALRFGEESPAIGAVASIGTIAVTNAAWDTTTGREPPPADPPDRG